MIKLLFPATALLALTACVPVEPVVSDFNGDSVKIILPPIVNADQGLAADQEAERICKAGGKRRAEHVSQRQLQDYRMEHLYLCLG